MFKKFADMSILAKFLTIGIGSILITIVAISLVGVWQGNTLKTQAQRQVDQLVGDYLRQVSEDVYNLVEVSDQTFQTMVTRNLDVARSILHSHGRSPAGYSRGVDGHQSVDPRACPGFAAQIGGR